MTKRRRSLSCWRLGRPFPLIWVALILCSLDVLVLFCTTFLVLRFLQVRSGHYSVRWNPARTLGRMGVQQPGCIRMEKWKIGYACINRDFRSNIKRGSNPFISRDRYLTHIIKPYFGKTYLQQNSSSIIQTKSDCVREFASTLLHIDTNSLDNISNSA